MDFWRHIFWKLRFCSEQTVGLTQLFVCITIGTNVSEEYDHNAMFYWMNEIEKKNVCYGKRII